MRARLFIGTSVTVFLLCSFCTVGGHGVLAQVASAEEKLRAAFSKGQIALQNGDLETAETQFRNVIAMDPRSGGAYSNLGVIAIRRKDWDHALHFLRTAEKLAPQVSGVRLNIALVYYRQGDYAAAIPPLSSVLRDRPDSEQAGYLLGLCELFVQDYTKAVATLEPLWNRKSNDFVYLYVLSIAANGAGDKELEEKGLTRLVEVGGDTAEFHLLLGKAYLNREETPNAIAELEHAASLNPSLPFLHFNLGIAYARTGNKERAEEEFHRDIAIEPDVPDTYELLGELYSRAGQDRDALAAYNEALSRNKRMTGSYFGIAKIYFHEKEYEPALAAIDSALRFSPSDQGSHNLRGQILSKLSRREEAQAEFNIVNKMGNSRYDKETTSFGQGRVPNPELTRQPLP